MGITVLITLLLVLLAIGLKWTRDCWHASRLSKQSEATQESHVLMTDPAPSTSVVCPHHKCARGRALWR